MIQMRRQIDKLDDEHFAVPLFGGIDPVCMAHVDHYHMNSALREGMIIVDNELRQEKLYLSLLSCLLQNETEQNYNVLSSSMCSR